MYSVYLSLTLKLILYIHTYTLYFAIGNYTITINQSSNQPSHSINQPSPSINQPPPSINQPPPLINQPPPSINQLPLAKLSKGIALMLIFNVRTHIIQMISKAHPVFFKASLQILLKE